MFSSKTSNKNSQTSFLSIILSIGIKPHRASLGICCFSREIGIIPGVSKMSKSSPKESDYHYVRELVHDGTGISGFFETNLSSIQLIKQKVAVSAKS